MQSQKTNLSFKKISRRSMLIDREIYPEFDEILRPPHKAPDGELSSFQDLTFASRKNASDFISKKVLQIFVNRK